MQSQCALRWRIVCKQVRNCDLSKKFLMFYETCAFMLLFLKLSIKIGQYLLK